MKLLTRMSAILLSTTITFSSFMMVNASEISSNEKECQAEVYECISDIEENNGCFSMDNLIVYDEGAIYDAVSNIDLETIKEQYKNYGISDITKEEIVELLVNGIEDSKNRLETGELTMLEDGSMVDADDDSYYLQGGSTYDKTYWWGRRRYKSTSAANKWVKKLNKTAAAEGGIGAIGGAILGPAPGIVGGIGCWICWDLASEVSYYNSLSKRGIKADIPWCIVGYKVRKQ